MGAGASVDLWRRGFSPADETAALKCRLHESPRGARIYFLNV